MCRSEWTRFFTSSNVSELDDVNICITFFIKPLLQILANVLKRAGGFETGWPAALIICIKTDSIVLDLIGL